MATEPHAFGPDAAEPTTWAAEPTSVIGTPRRAFGGPPPPPERTAVGAAVAHLEPHAAAEGVEAAQAHGRPRFLNRELSRLDYYARVLSNAGDASAPLLERAKFVGFFSMALDELFQVQVAGLKDQVAAGMGVTYPDGLSPVEQLRLIRARVEELVERVSELFVDDLVPALASAGIRFSSYLDLHHEDRTYLNRVFEQRVFPVLTPLAVDPGHPFPYISNLSLNLAITVRDPATGDRRFARIKVPPLLPRFVVLPDGERFIPLEQVIAAHLDQLFPGMDVLEQHPFRVTRNADLTLEEEEADDLLAAVELELRRRRFGRAVRLEVMPGMPQEVRELLTRELELGEEDVYTVTGALDLSGLFALVDLDRPDLKAEPWVPQTQPLLLTPEGTPADMFAVLRERDVLVHHPYDSFQTSVEAFIAEASTDPKVLAIKQTLYRTSGDSPIVKCLIDAAESGKQVAALVELKARFDEERNIEWARQLEEAGVHVVYGLVGLKTHCKCALVVRQDPDGMRRYVHLGTGNYNSKTAAAYEDFGLLTCDQDLGADLTDLFNYLTGYSRQITYRKLIVAPVSMRDRIIGLIQREQAAPDGTGHIIMKMNSLSDPDVIDALYEASSKGVRVELIVRGICCLRAGVPGLSENITVRSIVGGFLEHSRIYHFAHGPGGPEVVIGSADMMPRNLDGRVEALFPVTAPELVQQLERVLELLLADDTEAWQLEPDGTWTRVPTLRGVSAQETFRRDALARAELPRGRA